jgi:putative DNA primase/helicase
LPAFFDPHRLIKVTNKKPTTVSVEATADGSSLKFESTRKWNICMSNLPHNSGGYPDRNPILDHIGNLEVIKETPSDYQCICPICGGKRLIIEKKLGKYRCHPKECDPKKIFRAVVPEGIRKSSFANRRPVIKGKKQKSKIKPPEGKLIIARLQEPATNCPQAKTATRPRLGVVRETRYQYSDSQWVVRIEWCDPENSKGHSKKVVPWHIDVKGKPVNKKGEAPWPAYRIEEALEAARNTAANAVMGAEGEKSVEQYRQIGIACVTFMGSAWGKKELEQFAKHLKKEGLALVYHPDHDEPGYEKAQKVSEACCKEGVYCLVLEPLNLDPELPEAGDIVDILERNPNIEDFERILAEEIKRLDVQKENSIFLENAPIDSPEEGNNSYAVKVEKALYPEGYICVNGVLYKWETNHYRLVEDGPELRRIGNFLCDLPVVSRSGRTHYPYATPGKVRSSLEWVKIRNSISSELINPPGLLNFRNGVLSFDWSSEIPIPVFEAHNPGKHLITNEPLIEYRPDADSQHCERLLEALDPEQREIFLKSLGASLDLGEVRRRKGRSIRGLLAQGTGNNGKDALRMATSFVLGPRYMTGASLSDFFQYDNGRKFSLSKLAHSRFNWASENQDFVAIDKLQSLKAAITGDPIDIECKHQDSYEISPAMVFIFNINDTPNIKGALEAILDRYAVLNFGKVFKENPDPSKGELKADPRFKYDMDFLKTEVCPALLNKAIKALQDLIANGIDYSCTEKAFSEIQAENSHLYRFAQEVGLVYREDSVVSGKTDMAVLGGLV